MPDLSITAASVANTYRANNAPAAGKLAANEAVYLVGTAAITQGQAVYVSTSTGLLELADADALATALVKGIALSAGSPGQPIVIQLYGDIDLGATLTVGQIYVASTTAGGIAPYSDLGSGDYISTLGAADAADNMELDITNTGIAKA